MIARTLKVVWRMSTFRKKVQNKPKNNQTDQLQAFGQKMTNDVYEEFKKKIQKDTILRNFRKQIFKKQQIAEEFVQMQKNLEKQQKELEKMINTGTKQDVIKYSKKIMQKLLNNKKIFRQNTTNPIFSDYGDYSSYKQNYVKLQDRNLVDGQKLDVSNATQKWHEFVDTLPDDYQEKQNIKEHIRDQFDYSYDKISISEYGKMKQQKSDLADHFTKMQYDSFQNNVYGKQKYVSDIDQQQEFDSALGQTDPESFNLSRTARLSPQAINTIYQLYLQGWTVRDISRRFGILPQRTKFYIWARAIFYDQYLPKYGVKYLMDCIQEEAQLGKTYGYMDYGLDIDKMQSVRMPEEIIQWNSKRVDSQRKPQQYINALKVLDQKKKFDKYQMVQVGTHGKQNAMYSLKEWKVFRGRGSDQVHLRDKTFRSLSKAKRKMVKTYY